MEDTENKNYFLQITLNRLLLNLLVLQSLKVLYYLALKSSFNSRKRFQSTFQDVG